MSSSSESPSSRSPSSKSSRPIKIRSSSSSEKFEKSPESDSRYADCELKMLEQDGTNVYFVAFTDTKFDLREEYFMSLEHRVIISQRTLADGELVYSFETVAFSVEQSRYGDDRLYTTY